MGLIIDLRESIYWKADIIRMVRATMVSFHPYSHASPEIWLCEIKEITFQGYILVFFESCSVTSVVSDSVSPYGL